MRKVLIIIDIIASKNRNDEGGHCRAIDASCRYTRSHVNSCTVPKVLTFFRPSSARWASPSGLFAIVDPDSAACAAVLRGLSGTDEPAKAAAAAERAVQSLTVDASPVLLEGLARFARVAAGEESCLKALIFCALRSARAWESVLAARIPVHFSRFPELLAGAVLARDASKDGDLLSDFSRVSEAPVYPAFHHPVTPLALVVRRFSADPSVSPEDARKRVELLGTFSRKAWVQISSADLVATVQVLDAYKEGTDGHVDSVLKGPLEGPLQQQLEIPSCAAARICDLLGTRLPNEVAACSERHGLPFRKIMLSQRASTALFDEVTTPGEALAAGRAAFKSGNIEDAALAARRFIEKAQFDLACVVYIAFPKVLSRSSDMPKEVVRALCALPAWFRGPVDDSIDCALRSLLGAVPGLADVYVGLLDIETERAARLMLQRASLANPLLAYRRIEDICAAGFVLLKGLPKENDRYHPSSLSGMEVIFLALARVQIEVGERHSEVLEVALIGKDFLLEEGRIDNGIPSVLAPFTLALLQVLILYPEEPKSHSVVQEMTKLYKAPGTVEDVKEAIQRYLLKTKG